MLLWRLRGAAGEGEKGQEEEKSHFSRCFLTSGNFPITARKRIAHPGGQDDVTLLVHVYTVPSGTPESLENSLAVIL